MAEREEISSRRSVMSTYWLDAILPFVVWRP